MLDLYPDEGELLVYIAEIYIQLGNDDEALSTLGKIDKDDSSYLQGLLLQADLYESQGLFEVSEQKLLEAEKLEPEEPVIQFALAELYSSIGKFHEAVYKYEQILQKLIKLAVLIFMNAWLIFIQQAENLKKRSIFMNKPWMTN